jgi:chromosome partitioning protein
VAATVISITNFKGGVGKTTLAVNLAASLAHEFDKRVLLVDLDAQANASIWMLGARRWMEISGKSDHRETAYGLFLKSVTSHVPLKPYDNPGVKGRGIDKFWLLPSSESVLKLQHMIQEAKDQFLIAQKYMRDLEYRVLSRRLTRLDDYFDYVILDTPPDIYGVTCNAVFASDYLIVPCIPDSLSISGLRFLIEELTRITINAAKAPIVLGVAITRRKDVNEHNASMHSINAAVKDFQENAAIRMVDDRTVVFENYPLKDLIVHSEAVRANQPLCLYAPASPAHQDVRALTKAIKDAVEARP